MRERRVERRVALDRPMVARVKSSLPARVLDVSPRGIQLELGTCLRLHSECELRIQLEKGDVVLRAMVRRCRAWGFGLDAQDQRVLLYRVGLEFGDLASEALARLRREVAPVEEPKAATVPAAPVLVAVEEDDEEGAKASLGAVAPAPPGAVPKGPVKIRISSDAVRRILQRMDGK